MLQAHQISAAVVSSNTTFSPSFLSTFSVTGTPTSADVSDSTPPPAETPSSSALLSTGAIIGIAVGGFALLALIVVGAIIVVRRKGTKVAAGV